MGLTEFLAPFVWHFIKWLFSGLAVAALGIILLALMFGLGVV